MHKLIKKQYGNDHFLYLIQLFYRVHHYGYLL